MSEWLLIVAMVAAVAPFRTRSGLGPAPYGVPAVIVGVGVAVAAVGVLAAASAGMLEALQVTPETFLIAAGLVVIVAGARSVIFPRPHLEPALQGWRSGLWPLAFPRLLSPEVIALSLALPGQRGTGAVVGTTALAMTAAGLIALTRAGDRRLRFYAAIGAVGGAVLLTVGIWMMIEGIRDV